MIKQKKVTMIIHSTGIGYVTLEHRKKRWRDISFNSNPNPNPIQFYLDFFMYRIHLCSLGANIVNV